jgi:hypothetical protein
MEPTLPPTVSICIVYLFLKVIFLSVTGFNNTFYMEIAKYANCYTFCVVEPKQGIEKFTNQTVSNSDSELALSIR